jgi:hypothetical protein
MFAIAQAGSALQVVKTDGTVVTLTLPTDVTIDATKQGSFAVLNQQILFTGASTVNLWIDPSDLTVRHAGLQPPLSAPVLAAGSGVGLTGSYQVAVAFAVKDGAGNIVNQSTLSGTSLAVVLANNDIAASQIEVSPDPNVNCRVLYRTAAGGTDLFQWITIDDNHATTITDGMSDKSLSLFPANPALGCPPGSVPGTELSLTCVWKSRVWGVSGAKRERDDALFTEINQFYAWPAENSLPAYPKGEDEFGITGLAPRRDALGLLKRNRVLKVIGSSPEDFQVVIVSPEGSGCVAKKSVVIIRDVAYWLGLDGVYRWDDSGVVCISRSQVDGWFTKGDTFNQDRFQYAFGGWNPLTNAYELTLASAGSSVENRTVKYFIDQGEWMGPDDTAAFTPTARALLVGGQDQLIPTVAGADGYLYAENQTTLSDVSGAGVTWPIGSRFSPKWYSAGAPDINHFWGQPSFLTAIQALERITGPHPVVKVQPYLAYAVPKPVTPDTFSRKILSLAPEAYWRFEETGALTARDWSGHGHTVTMPTGNTVRYHQPGAIGGGSYGIGISGDRCTLANPLDFRAGPFAQVWWLTALAQGGTGYGTLMCDTREEIQGFFLFDDTPGFVRVVYSAFVDGAYVEQANNTLIPVGVDVVIGISVDASGVGTFTLNGVADGTFTYYGDLIFDSVFGHVPDFGGTDSDTLACEYLRASLVDEVSTFNQALAVSDMLAIFVAGQAANVAAYHALIAAFVPESEWRLEAASGATFVDSTANAHDLVMTDATGVDFQTTGIVGDGGHGYRLTDATQGRAAFTKITMPATNFTVMFGVIPANNLTSLDGWNALADYDRDGQHGQGWYLFRLSDTTVRFDYFGFDDAGTNTPTASATVTLNVGAEYLLWMTVDGDGRATFYVGTQPAGTFLYTGKEVGAIDTLFNNHLNQSSPLGLLGEMLCAELVDEWAVFFSCLTDEQIADVTDLLRPDPIDVDLTLGRQINDNLGDDNLIRLDYRMETPGKGFMVYGHEIAPVFENGRR